MIDTVRFRILAASLLAFCLSAASARPARAQDLSEQDKAAAKDHYDKGRAAFDQGKYDEAVKELKQSYMLSRKPAILFNIGQTYKQLGDAPLALHFFQKFVAEAEPTDPNRSVAQAAIEELNAEAARRGQTLAPPGEGQPAEGQPTETKPPDFRHVAIGEAPPRHPVDVKIRLGEEAKAFPSFLYYRAPGEESFAKVPMAPAAEGSTDLWARIPKRIMSKGKSVQYYVETRGPDGAVYGASGTGANPNVIVVDPKAKRKDNPDLDEGEPEPGKGPPDYTRFYKPAKWVTAGLATVSLGVAVGFGAYGARLTTDLEKRARESSVKTPEGSWSYPQLYWDGDSEDLDQKGRRTNTIATLFALTGGALAVASGVLFFLDYRRAEAEHAADEEELSLLPMVGPDFAGGAAAFRF